jgi:hypothetical protein
MDLPGSRTELFLTFPIDFSMILFLKVHIAEVENIVDRRRSIETTVCI